MAIEPFYVYHPTTDSVIISGNCICTQQLATNGSATYYISQNTFAFKPDSTGSHHATPMRHVSQTFRLFGDSLKFSISSVAIGCSVDELQTFEGRKTP